ncbi:hypothetical protein GYMLUDRAFT_64183 [Collybiopsis luxurians FD-317 M1]|uniref:Uncharacterized protein n=1 Tax=Collybiopsis luxurians FD-317 M1 TaxID=944289 RepID=A0A0D0AQG9_9AGAR|nr:hypothetical protein GYMLUDRAFT_64183 [Collybiopsis luxurians FD-317 M1]
MNSPSAPNEDKNSQALAAQLLDKINCSSHQHYLLRKQLTKQKIENIENEILAVQLQNHNHTLEAQILTQNLMCQDKYLVYQELCQSEVKLLQQFADAETGCVVEDMIHTMSRSYNAKCKEYQDSSDDSAKLLVMLQDRQTILNQEEDRLCKEL